MPSALPGLLPAPPTLIALASRSILRVAWRSARGAKPGVTQHFPIIQRSVVSRQRQPELAPFPTLYWLCDSSLITRVSAIESDGGVARIQDKLQGSSIALDAMRSCHHAYAQERWSLLTETFVEYVDNAGWKGALLDTGVAGIRDWDCVKCLHTHLAHYLARPEHGNVVGGLGRRKRLV